MAILAGGQVNIIRQNPNQQDSFSIVKTINLPRNQPSSYLEDDAFALVAIEQGLAVKLGSKLWLLSLETNDKEEYHWRPLSQGHVLPLVSARFAAECPIIATLSSKISTGSEHSGASLMILNSESGTSEVFESYLVGGSGHGVPIYADMHPSGHMVVLTNGFQVRLQRILADSLAPVTNFPMTACKTCLFSAGGHYFAASSPQKLLVWGTYMRSSVMEVQNLEQVGVTGTVLSLLWSCHDTKLILATSEGFWMWFVPDGKPIAVHKMTDNTELIACALGGSNIFYTCTAKGRLQLFDLGATNNSFNTGNVQSAELAGTAHVEMPQGATATAFTVGESVLVLGCSNGEVILIDLPLNVDTTSSLSYGKSIRCILRAVTSLAIKEEKGSLGVSEGEIEVFVGGSDGCVTLLTSSEGDLNVDCNTTSLPGQSAAIYSKSDDVLVPRPALEALKLQVQRFSAKLQTAVEEKTAQLTAESDKLVAQLKEIKLKLSQAEDENFKISQARQAEHAQHQAELTHRLHVAEMAFEGRLGIMEEKLSQGMREEATMRIDAEKKLHEALELQKVQAIADEEGRTEVIAATARNIETLLSAERELKLRAESELESLKIAWETEKKNMEIRSAAKLENAKTEAEEILAAERASVQRLRGECAVLRQRYEAQGLEAQVAKSAAQQKIDAAEKLRKEKEGLLRDFAGVKSELAAREMALKDKEGEVAELSSKNNDLQRRYAAMSEACTAEDKELQGKKERIQELVQQIENLRAECRAAVEARTAAELTASSRKQKEAATRKEGAAHAETVKRLHNQIRKISSDISDAAALIQQPHELKAAVVKLYHKHALPSKQKEEESNRKDGEDGRKASSMEIEDLRAIVARLQGQIEEQRVSATAERRRAVVENSELLREVNRLQEENEVLKRNKGKIGSGNKGPVDVQVKAGSPVIK